jgi:hypothetical protein
MRSTALARFSMDSSVPRRSRFASAEVSRSSHRCTGSRNRFRKSSANTCILSDWVPSAPLMRRGRPTTICRTIYSRTIRSRAARSCRLFRRCKVSNPCAVMPRGSETAIPILLDPTSKPRTLPAECSLLGSGLDRVADASPGLNSKGKGSIGDLGLWKLKQRL